MLDLSDLCRAWGLPPILSTRTPETGTIHRTFLLKTVSGSYALRAYRYTAPERGRIEREHALITYVQARSLPAIAPLPLPRGGSILEQDGHFYALFPFAPGHQTPRGHLTLDETQAMGNFLGKLHQVLHDYPHEQVSQRKFTFERETTLATIDTIEKAIRSQPFVSSEDEQALSRLMERRAWLTKASPVNLTEFSDLEQQVIHGDYQETNLFFENDQVRAVIDWDQAYVASRAWEVVRTLHYTFKLEGTACRAFLDAYRRVLPLPSADLEIAAASYGWKREHDMWQYKELYLENNQRVRAFFEPGPFIPFAQRWATLRAFLPES